MALALPPWRFGYVTDNLTGTPPAAVVGVNFTAGANDVDGASVAVLGSMTTDTHYIALGIGGLNVGTGDGQCALDLLTDPAGGTSWTNVLISDLACGFTLTVNTGAPPTQWYYFPLWVRSGTSFAVRCKTAHTADITTGRIVMYAYGEPSRPDMWWCGQKVETVGISDSRGTSITPGAAGVFGSWTNVGSVTTGRYGALQLGVNGTDSNASALGYYWQIGSSSSKLPGTPNFFTATTSAEVGPKTGMSMPIWCDVPSGTQLQVRGTASGGSPENNFVALYGVI